jgi:uncharacterized membrane protein YdjX (TVP38/TMEM64 family)
MTALEILFVMLWVLVPLVGGIVLICQIVEIVDDNKEFEAWAESRSAREDLRL